jgi:DNA adenine methylase
MKPLRLQPIPYQGSKRSLAPRIGKLFPAVVETLYEPFAGSAAMTVYAANFNLAKHFVIGDIYPELVSLLALIINNPADISDRYKAIWEDQFAVGVGHFNLVRAQYNADRDPARLLYLIARCVKNAIRFNRRGDFTQSADKRRNGMHPSKFEASAHRVSALLRGRTDVVCLDFTECVAAAGPRDLVYMDPPYQGTTYGADKRYAEQLERERLVGCLADLNQRQVPFILSYDGKTGDKEYGARLPDSLNATHLYIHAGRSSQATLAGRSEETLESIYISSGAAEALAFIPDYEKAQPQQAELFA